MRDGRPLLDAASDRDVTPEGTSVEQALADRSATAGIIAAARADVLALQEVFDLAALKFFNDTFLSRAGAGPYPFRYCPPGNDGSGNVAALLNLRPLAVKSHADLTGGDLHLEGLPKDLRERPLFRRDCLEIDLDNVTLFLCHFKSPYPDPERARIVREAEARAVRKIVEARFADPVNERWIVLGDLNEPTRPQTGTRTTLAALRIGFAVDLMERLPPGEDWTYEVADIGMRTCPDRILLSPLLAREYPDVRPQIVRTGSMGDAGEQSRASGAENGEAPHASDHALVLVDLDGL